MPPIREDGAIKAPEGLGEDFGDSYYHGTVVRIQHGRKSGIIKTGNGREVRFQIPFVDFMNFQSLDELSEGMVVGFDLGWTSKGIRVTKVKIYDES